MIFKTLSLVIVFLCIYSSAPAQDLSKPPAPTLPSFTLFRFNNTAFTNNDIPNGKILLFVFIDPSCDHCQLAVQCISGQYDAFKNSALFIVSEFTRVEMERFMSSYGIRLKGKKNVTLLRDKQQQFILKFNPRRYPSMMLYSPEGRLLDYEDNPDAVFRLVNTVNRASK